MKLIFISYSIMNNIFDILDKDYKLIKGVGSNGGYHAQMLLSRLLEDIN